MRKIITMLIAVLMVSSIASASPGSGSIWTTNGDCGDENQDVNHFDIGDVVYINGANFDEDDYDWSIVGQPGQASCDPGAVVAAGNENVDDKFCFAAYTVAADDCGEYKVQFGKKQDNYRVKGEDEQPPSEVPEFTAIGAGLALLGAGLYASRKRKKN